MAELLTDYFKPLRKVPLVFMSRSGVCEGIVYQGTETDAMARL